MLPQRLMHLFQHMHAAWMIKTNLNSPVPSPCSWQPCSVLSWARTITTGALLHGQSQIERIPRLRRTEHVSRSNVGGLKLEA